MWKTVSLRAIHFYQRRQSSMRCCTLEESAGARSWRLASGTTSEIPTHIFRRAIYRSNAELSREQLRSQGRRLQVAGRADLQVQLGTPIRTLGLADAKHRRTKIYRHALTLSWDLPANFVLEERRATVKEIALSRSARTGSAVSSVPNFNKRNVPMYLIRVGQAPRGQGLLRRRSAAPCQVLLGLPPA